jgi:epoxyqueuosine reductase
VTGKDGSARARGNAVQKTAGPARAARPAAAPPSALPPAAPLAAALAAALGAAGYRHRLAPVRVAEQLHQAIIDLRDQGLLRGELYEEYAAYWAFAPPPEVAEPRTVIVGAWASQPVKVRFHLHAGPLEAVIPPTYVSSAGRARCLETLRSVLEPAGHSVGRASGPVKLLAVRAGLAQYGRNNLAYVRGMGSYARLDAFCTDADLGAVEHRTKASMLMSCCPPCRNCHHVCPTGCIPHDGTVIDATHCLTYLNEREGDWPDWLEPVAHNSLVGCMRCQEMCPANRYYLRKEEVLAEFDREETEIILRNLSPEELPEALRVKLRKIDLEADSTILGRNLLALGDAGAARPSL